MSLPLRPEVLISRQYPKTLHLQTSSPACTRSFPSLYFPSQGIIGLEFQATPSAWPPSLAFCRRTGNIVVEQPVEFRKINIGNPLIAADHDHVLIIVIGGGLAEIGRAGDDHRIIPQGIYQQKLGMDIGHMFVEFHGPRGGLFRPAIEIVLDIGAPGLVHVLLCPDIAEGLLALFDGLSSLSSNIKKKYDFWRYCLRGSP